MPPDMEVSMRHTKLKPEEAALLAGEISKPSWESRNEGIHERVSFEDTIWGFDLAGGAYYKTPLRVTSVKPDSRAEKAGIRPGDKLLRINDIDTSTLTIQEAHDEILSSGIHLKLSVTSPDDDEDAYYCYEDPIVDGYDSEEERRLEEEREKKRRVHAKVSSYWSLQWPWCGKKKLIYRESNCFLVNSKYEEARRDKYPPVPVLRYTDDIMLFQRDAERLKSRNQTPSIEEPKETEEKDKHPKEEKMTTEDTDISVTDSEQINHSEEEHSEVTEPRIPSVIEENDTEEINFETSVIEEPVVNGDLADIVNGHDGDDEISEALSPIPEILEETSRSDTLEVENDISDVLENDDHVINEVLAKNNDSIPRTDDDNILDSILSDDGQNLENSEANNER